MIKPNTNTDNPLSKMFRDYNADSSAAVETEVIPAPDRSTPTPKPQPPVKPQPKQAPSAVDEEGRVRRPQKPQKDDEGSEFWVWFPWFSILILSAELILRGSSYYPMYQIVAALVAAGWGLTCSRSNSIAQSSRHSAFATAYAAGIALPIIISFAKSLIQ